MTDGFALYHWAPRERRKSIERRGLEPGHWSPDRLWKPPCICLANGPKMAWLLCGRYRPGIREWDLWWVSSLDLEGYEIIPSDDGEPREYRVYHRIYKRHLWMVGTRVNEHYQTTESEGDE